MTAHTEDVIRNRLMHALQNDDSVALGKASNAADILLTDASGQSVYDVAMTDEAGIWVFLANALYDANAFSDTPVLHDAPDETIVPDSAELATWTNDAPTIVAEPVATSSASAGKWVMGGVSLLGLLATGAALAHHQHHQEAVLPQHQEDTPPKEVPPPELPKPQALVIRYATSEHPFQTEPSETIQAESPPPKDADTTEPPPSVDDADAPKIVMLSSDEVFRDAPSDHQENDVLVADDAVHYPIVAQNEMHDDVVLNPIL